MQTAELLGIHRTTLRNWKLTHDEIRRLYQSDGQDGDEERKKQVEEALLKDGKLGVVKTVEKQVMPSTTAQIFWLKNRCGYEWDGGVVDDEENEGGVVVIPEARTEHEGEFG